MSLLHSIPEILGLESRRGLLRIPPETDVPLTPRVQRIIDTAAFRRLAHISQLGLVSLVYPAAHHTRFEHSLGVYRTALVYLQQLAADERFAAAVTEADAKLLIVGALLHDIGHWPFCHPIEDIRLAGVPRHEQFARRHLLGSELAELLERDWQVAPEAVVALLAQPPASRSQRILQSILSGPIDIDKMDYLARDSLHAGVPYGRNFDQQRLIGSLCLNEAGDALAIRDKGRTAAEMMVFARYVMFSEVYWHHAVRSATAMLQRAFAMLHHDLALDALFGLSERAMIERMQATAAGRPAAELLDGLFGPRRRLYKRLAQFSLFEQPELYGRLARRPYPMLVAFSRLLAERLGQTLGQPVREHEVLFDAPPQKREVEFRVEIYFEKEDRYRSFGDVSPVVQTLAQKQFDDYVKRVRIFVHPRLVDVVRGMPDFPAKLGPILHEVIDAVDGAHAVERSD